VVTQSLRNLKASVMRSPQRIRMTVISR